LELQDEQGDVTPEQEFVQSSVAHEG